MDSKGKEPGTSDVGIDTGGSRAEDFVIRESVKIKTEAPPSSSSTSTDQGGASSIEEGNHNSPTVIIIMGMAGSGKTSLTQRIGAHLMAKGTPPYLINLDPACFNMPFPANIDIRDTINYKNVMKQYNLGPNGAIITSLNLFATKFDQVIELIKQRSKSHKYVIIDTPGQIEVFMWSASGQIITECLAALFPTVMIYVTDLVSCSKPFTFISNMSCACSILYKTRLPLVIALNKCDICKPEKVISWITDFDVLDDALKNTEGYAANLAGSMALALDEMYHHIEHTVVSAYDGYGMNEFFTSIEKAVVEYETAYRPTYERLRKEKNDRVEAEKKSQLKKLHRDLKTSTETSGSIASESLHRLISGPDGGAGLKLSLGGGLNGDDDSTSSSEEEERDSDSDENINAQVTNTRKLRNKNLP